MRVSFLAQINETVDWMYGAGENAPLEEIQRRLKTFRALGEPIKKRYIFYSTVGENF